MDAITQESLSETGWDKVPFDNSYARLPEVFYTRLDPTPVSNPRLIKVNTALAEAIGIDPEILTGADSAGVLAGNLIPENAEPLAMVYAGHQFGNWVPRLGDGRAILLGEIVGPDGKTLPRVPGHISYWFAWDSYLGVKSELYKSP